MTLIIEDRVAETTTSTGTSNITLAGALTAYRTFASVCAVSDTCYYMIEAVDANGMPTGEWEAGLGTYSATNTLTRTTVHNSSNADAAVNFAAGTKRVAMALSAAHISTFATSTGRSWSGAPGYISSGAVTETAASGTTSFNVAYPNDVQAGDAIILFVTNEDVSTPPTVNAPTGFTLIGQPRTSIWVFIKNNCAGTETGNIAVTTSAGAANANSYFRAAMHLFGGVLKSGTPYEGAGTASGSDAHAESPTVMTTDINRLVCNFIGGISSTGTSTAPAGYTEHFDQSFTLGYDGLQTINTIEQATAATVASSTTAFSTNIYWGCISFALIPDPGSNVLDALDDVTTTGATDGQALVYDADTGTWVPGTVSGGSGSSSALAFAGCRLRLAAELTAVNASAGIAIPYTTESYDTNSFHDNATNNTRITIPAGVSKVRLTAGLYVNLVGASPIINGFFKNGAVLEDGAQSLHPFVSGVTDYLSLADTGIISVSPGDYFEHRYLCGDTSTTIKTGNTFFALEVVEGSILGATAGSAAGTAFPASPTTGDRFFRTDRGIEYYWDGTRWLSTTSFRADVAIQDQLLPLTISTTIRASNPEASLYDMYVERVVVGYYPSAGTTASNYFTMQLAYVDVSTSTNVGSAISTQNATLSQWAHGAVSANVVVPSTADVFQLTCTETGTSTTWVVGAVIHYRLVG